MITRKARRWISKSPYEVLGLTTGASQIEVKAAYYRLVKLHHPDVTQGSGTKFKEIKEAYTALSSTSTSPQFEATDDKPFDSGDAYIFRQQTRQQYTYKKQQEEQEQEKKEEKEEVRPVHETWRTEIIVFSVVSGYLLFRILLAEDERQQHMNRPYELSISEYQKELDLDEKEFETYVRSKDFEKVLRGK